MKIQGTFSDSGHEPVEKTGDTREIERVSGKCTKKQSEGEENLNFVTYVKTSTRFL